MAESIINHTGIPLEKIEHRNEAAAAENKNNDQRYREYAKENRRKKAHATQAAEQAAAEERKAHGLVERHEEAMEALDYASRQPQTDDDQSHNERRICQNLMQGHDERIFRRSA